MDSPPALPVWLHCPAPLGPDGSARIRSALELAGLAVTGLPVSLRGSCGVVGFDSASGALFEQVQRLSAEACVLALATCASALPPDTLWRLLDAGAADVLWWAPGADIGAQVAARLTRWRAVEQLAESEQVQRQLVGRSAAWRALVREVVEVAAFSASPVLITGETGTGKDLIAGLIHELGHGQGQLTVLDCTTLSPELCGSELFGHERGAFTGAASARDGAFALADGGTLFLDEVGELPLPLQAQLLRAIQERQYKRLGSNSWQPTRFRLVCATNRELEQEVAQGRFRADLFYRIAGWRCRPPPLRERRDDILPLVSHFLAQLAPQGQACELDPAVRHYLLTRDYPGNVRDLRQTVARIWHRHCGCGPMTIGALPPDERQCGAAARQPGWPDLAFEGAIRHALALGLGLGRISQAAAELAIRIVLEQENGSNQRAALRLGISDRALQMRRKAQADGGERPG